MEGAGPRGPLANSTRKRGQDKMKFLMTQAKPMKRWRRPHGALLTAVFAGALFICAHTASARSESENFVLQAVHLGGGGGFSNSTFVQANTVIGEAIVGTASSPNFNLVAGMLAGATASGDQGLILSIVDAPASVGREETLTWSVKIDNVGTSDAGFDHARFDVTGPASPSIIVFSGGPVVLPGGGSIGPHDLEIFVPAKAPLADYSIETVIALDGTDISSDSYTVTVTP